MTIEERKNRILAKIVEMQAEGQAEGQEEVAALRKQVAELDAAYAEGVQSV